MALNQSELSLTNSIMHKWLPLFFAMSCHRTHRGVPLDFINNPFLKQIYADESPDAGVMKSTQCGLSEYILCREIALACSGRNIFHVLPTDRLIGRFVRERMDKTIEATQKYRDIVKQTKSADNITMKQFGAGTIVFVGSNSESSFAEFPADDAIIDEFDRCDQKNVLMVDDRLSASQYRTKFTIANPTVTDYGIHKLWKDSKQYEWFVKCPHCGEWVHPNFFEHVVEQVEDTVWTLRDTEWDRDSKRDIFAICKCGKPLDLRADGKWLARNGRADKSFYHVSKMFSTMVSIKDLCDAFNKGLENDEAMARFYNSDLGLPYTPKGAKFTDDTLNQCISDYILPNKCERPCIAGVDVGTVLHCRVNEILPDGSEKAVFFGELRDVEELAWVCHNFNIVAGVIDAMPEQRLSKRVAQWKGWVRCFFQSPRAQDNLNLQNMTVSVNRTELIDSVKAKFDEHRCYLPKNAQTIKHYYEHMKELTRVFNEARNEYDWVGDGADHYLFAEVYMAVARRILGKLE